MKTVLTVIATICIAGAVCAESRILDLDACLEAGLANSVAVRNARRDRAIADARFDQALSDALPHFSLSAEYTRLDELTEIDLGGATTEFGTLDNYSAGARVDQTLFSGGRVRAGLRAARIYGDYAQQALVSAESALQRDIKTSFFDILLAKARVQVREASLHQLEENLKQVKAKHEQGAVSRFDLLTSQVKTSNERPLLLTARNALELSLEGFRRLLDLGPEAFDVDGELACNPVDVDAADVLDRALLRRADLQRARALVELRRADVTNAGADGLPNVSAGFSYTGANAYQFVTFENEWEWHWQAMVKLNWNIWDGGMTRGFVREKRLELEKAMTDLDDARQGIQLEVRAACLNLRLAREAIETAKGNVELAESALTIAKSRYDQGLSTQLEFTDSNLALSTARLASFQALRDYLAARAELQYASGLPDSEFEEICPSNARAASEDNQ